jgi:type IX secretion system PorP/SprF family membrane protein
MKKTRLLLLAIAVVAVAHRAAAQQLPQLTQYMHNDYLFNQAVAGSRPFFELRSAHRHQWVGVQDAPRSFMLSGSTPLGKSMGVGAYLFTDHVGPTRRTGFQASYAYHLRLTDDLKLGLALSGGLLQFLMDGSKITLRDQGDPVMDDQLRGELKPDATFSFLLHHPRFWVGAAAPQLINNEVVFLHENTGTLSRMERHYYAMGGYRLQVGDDFRIEPSFMVKYVAPVPMKIDLNVIARYKETVWIGGGYRTNDAWCAMLGYWHKQQLQFGYSYDVITSNLRNYSTGTHEVMLAVTIAKAPKSE